MCMFHCFYGLSGMRLYFRLYSFQLGSNASFTSLRTRGAFLVSGEISSDGIIGPLIVSSQAGSNFTFVDPFSVDPSQPPVVRNAVNGSQVPVTNVFSAPLPNVWMFSTTSGIEYVITAA